MVIAPARTGRDNNNKMAVSRTDQTNSGINSMVMPSPFIFVIVVMKLADPRILETPARWREKMPKSTALPGCPNVDKGG